MGDSVTLSVVVPLYNEIAHLPALSDALHAWFDPDTTQFILVDDGSSDDTARVATAVVDGLPHAVLVRLGTNTGKGAAVRAGVAEAVGDVVMFMDADLACDLECLPALLGGVSVSPAAIGSRTTDGSSTTGSSRLRVTMGRVYSLVGRLVAGTGVRDAQCGFKAFRLDVAQLVFALSSVDRFAFDTEVLRLLRILGFEVVEVPVAWTARSGSSVRPVRDSTRTLLDTLAMRLRTPAANVRARAKALGWTPAPPGDRAVLAVED